MVDYNQVGYSTIEQASSSVQVQAGMELYTRWGGSVIGPTQYSGNFNNYIRVYKNGVGWQYLNGGNSYGTVVDGCGSGALTGYCLNGISYQASEWSDSKPQ